MRPPRTLASFIERVADVEGLKSEAWGAKAAAESAGTEYVTAGFSGRRAAGNTGEKLGATLARVSDAPPLPSDEMLADLQATLNGR